MRRKFWFPALLLLSLTCAAQSASNVSANKTVGQTATLSWSAPTTYTTGAPITAGTAITYSVYEAQQASGTTCGTPNFGAPAVTGVTSTDYVTPPYTTVGVYCYDVTDTVAGTESAPSNIVSAIVSNPVPKGVSVTIQ